MKKIILIFLILGGLFTNVFAQQLTEAVFDSLVSINSKRNENEQICIVLIDSNFRRSSKCIYCPDSTNHNVNVVRDELFEKITNNKYQYVYFSVWGRNDILSNIFPVNPFFKRPYDITYHDQNIWPEILNGNMKVFDKRSRLVFDITFKNGMLFGKCKSYSHNGHLYSISFFDKHYNDQENSYLEIRPGTDKSVFHYIENNKWKEKKMNDSTVKSIVYPCQKSNKITIYCKLKRNFWMYFPPTFLFEDFFCIITGNNHGPVERTWFSEIIVNDSLNMQIKGNSYQKFDFFSDSLRFKVGNPFLKYSCYDLILNEASEYYFRLFFSKESKKFELVQVKKEVAEKEMSGLKKLKYF